MTSPVFMPFIFNGTRSGTRKRRQVLHLSFVDFPLQAEATDEATEEADPKEPKTQGYHRRARPNSAFLAWAEVDGNRIDKRLRRPRAAIGTGECGSFSCPAHSLVRLMSATHLKQCRRAIAGECLGEQRRVDASAAGFRRAAALLEAAEAYPTASTASSSHDRRVCNLHLPHPFFFTIISGLQFRISGANIVTAPSGTRYAILKKVDRRAPPQPVEPEEEEIDLVSPCVCAFLNCWQV